MATTIPARAAAPAPRLDAGQNALVRWFRDIGRGDVTTVGGKGANLGEMTRAGLPVPPGFVLPVSAWARFRAESGIGPQLEEILDGVVPDDYEALQRASGELRAIVERATIPADLAGVIENAYATLAREQGPPAASGRATVPPLAVAVRSSATAEDTAQFSFAGMFESFLNVQGGDELLRRVKECWASTFHARVLFYRLKQDMPAEMPVAVVVQAMVRSGKSGVLFTVDPSTRDPGRMVVEAAWGLGEVVVLGQVQPDHYVVDKRTLAALSRVVGHKDFMLVRDAATGGTARVELEGDARADATVLTDEELRAVADLGRRSEAHYGVPQDVEFAIEGDKVFLTQTRPITTLAKREAPRAATGEAPPRPAGRHEVPNVHGLGASPGVAAGPVRLLATPADGARLLPGEVLVTRMTSPDWVPVMRKAVAVVTDAGGMTSHAAIVSRELGIPCVVGTRDATRRLKDGDVVRVDGGAGTVTSATELPATPGADATAAATAAAPATKPAAPAPRARPVTATRLYVNLSEPDRAEEVARMDVDGVGLLRAELMMLTALDRTHPRRLLQEKRENEFVARMATQLRTFARAFAPRPVVYRAMDFRSNEYRGLVGGDAIEPHEDNPMIGYRGCYRYVREPELFALELRALAEVRREHHNLHLMIPFVRTMWELRECLALVDRSALAGDRALQRWIMAEVPSVVYWLPQYAKLGISGVSIGSNDLTQLVLGVDRDGELVAPLFDERDPAVLDAIHSIIEACRANGLTCSICGQAPSVYPDYAERLVRWGIDSVSVNPDVVDETRRALAAAEQRILLAEARGAARERADVRGWVAGRRANASG